MAEPVRHTTEVRQVGADERSLGELFAELSRETSDLVRQEVALAKAEMTQKATQVGKDVGFLVAGGAVVYAGFLALIAAFIVGLGQAGLVWWISALLVGIIVAGIGGFLVLRGIDDLKKTSLAPDQTMATLQEDTQWAKEQTR
jgi:hypothetical protein